MRSMVEGHGIQRFVFVAEHSSSTTPLPPHFVLSPSPTVVGEERSGRTFA